MVFRSSVSIILCCGGLLTAAADNYLAYRQDDDDCITDFEVPAHWRLEFYAGAMSQGADFGLSVAYLPIPYVGIKAEIGLPMEWNGFIDDVINSWTYPDDYYYGQYDDDYVCRFTFSPLLQLYSPALLKIKSSDVTFHLFANGGITLSPGAAGSYRAKWCYWRGQAGLEARIFNNFNISLSYRLSNFYLYDGIRQDVYNNGNTHRTGAILLTIGTSF